MIRTVVDLEKAYPELVASIRQKAKKTYDKNRIQELVELFFGDEAGQKFQSLADSGLMDIQTHNLRKHCKNQDRPAMKNPLVDFNRAVNDVVVQKKYSRAVAINYVAEHQPSLYRAYQESACA